MRTFSVPGTALPIVLCVLSHLILDEEIRIKGSSLTPLLKMILTFPFFSGVLRSLSWPLWLLQSQSLSLTTRAISLSASVYLGSPELGQW